ncbi:hypothetical protein GII40_00503 [Candidatus Profftia lariciata]|uniref:YqgE/AlgH family protein n=1 Tax=Candidatus Profftia lariciata TaxID=1987921 RepID=UPI001D0120EC|nr:YqgE/AlgH family protein [Candidatus Profftia lariciata]UDG81685.1 hypothetical protein GII40_00503 [Candidatus Profftia lariciata]
MNLVHHFLIAMPSIQESSFKYTVIYICEHTNKGAMGLVINRTLEHLTIEMLLKTLKITPELNNINNILNKPIICGGPLSEDRGFVLHTPQSNFNSSITISTECMMTTSCDVLETLGTTHQPKNILIALGYCKWDAGQLEQELLDNVWLTVEAYITLIFHTPISERWIAASKKIGVDIRKIVTSMGHA